MKMDGYIAIELHGGTEKMTFAVEQKGKKMNDYISRSEAIEWCLEGLNNMPGAQLEIVRCNQCEYYQGVHGVQGHAPCDYWKSSGVMYNWYCSQGKYYKDGGINEL